MAERYAMCNELFEGPLADTAAFLAELGYAGLELAPYTLCDDVHDLTGKVRHRIRREIEDNGLLVVGLHWLLAHTEGKHLCSSDSSQREAAADYLLAEIDLCAELGGSILVLGSPAQRNPCEGVPFAKAWGWFRQTMAHCGERAADCGVTLCIEALPAPECAFITCIDEAIKLVEEVGRPGFGLMVDVKAMAHDSRPVADQIRLVGDRIRHVHVNDPNRLGPGMGDVAFEPIMAALNEIGYDGWLSVEAFDTIIDPHEIARQSIYNLRTTQGA